MLEAAHDRRFDDDSSPEHLLQPICRVLHGDVTQQQWSTMCSSGFLGAVIHCLLDDYFCGYSKHYLISEKGEGFTTLVSKLTMSSMRQT